MAECPTCGFSAENIEVPSECDHSTCEHCRRTGEDWQMCAPCVAEMIAYAEMEAEVEAPVLRKSIQ